MGVARLSNSQYADTFRDFTSSCGDRLTGDCRLPGCRWRAAPGDAAQAARSHGQRRVIGTPWQRRRRGERNATKASAAPGLPAFHPRVNGDDSNAAAFNAPAASAGLTVTAPSGVARRNRRLGIRHSGFRSAARARRGGAVSAHCPRVRHSRKRAGTNGAPAAFSSSASWPLLQPLRCSASNRCAQRRSCTAARTVVALHRKGWSSGQLGE